MKKFMFLLVAALMSATMSFGQSSLVATLSHEGEITTYYGATAYREAVYAAAHGDIITLSSGSFGAVNITKALTIRGAGMAVDTVAKTYPTILSGDFSIQIPDSINQWLTMEGLYNDATITVKGTLKNATFLKDRFKGIQYESTSTQMKNLTFIHCKIASTLKLPSYSSASCVNSFIANPRSYDYTSSNFEFTNCVIEFRNSYNNYILSDDPDHVYSSMYNNCVIYVKNNYRGSISSNCTAYNCVGRTESGYDLFGSQANTTNWELGKTAYSTLFKTYMGNYSDDETFELTDEAKSKYLGDDGTEVGMYGGSFPFDPTTSNPQITKCNVASKSTADGKLSVEIEVKAGN